MSSESRPPTAAEMMAEHQECQGVQAPFREGYTMGVAHERKRVTDEERARGGCHISADEAAMILRRSVALGLPPDLEAKLVKVAEG